MFVSAYVGRWAISICRRRVTSAKCCVGWNSLNLVNRSKIQMFFCYYVKLSQKTVPTIFPNGAAHATSSLYVIRKIRLANSGRKSMNDPSPIYTRVRENHKIYLMPLASNGCWRCSNLYKTFHSSSRNMK